MSARECTGADWFALGREDVLDGFTTHILEDRAAQCASRGVDVDRDSWLAGYESELDAICTEEGGADFGRRRVDYRGVCEGEYEIAFLTAYLPEKRLADAKARVADARRARCELAEDIDRTRRLSSEDDEERTSFLGELAGAVVDAVFDKESEACDIDRALDDLSDAGVTLGSYDQERLRDVISEEASATSQLRTLRETDDAYRDGQALTFDRIKLQYAHEMVRQRPDAFRFCVGGGRRALMCLLTEQGITLDGGEACVPGPGVVGIVGSRQDLSSDGSFQELTMTFGKTDQLPAAGDQPPRAARFEFAEGGAIERLTCVPEGTI